MFGIVAEESTESLADFPAKTSALPAKAVVSAKKRSRALRGATCSGSFEVYARLGSSLRMFLDCELSQQTGYSLHWKESATPAGRAWWVLNILERHIEGIESGSWLTPHGMTAIDNTGKLGAGGELHQQVMRTWGKPRCSDGMQHPLRNPSDIGNARGRLEDQVSLESWPTPDASMFQDGESPETFLARREKLKLTANNGNGCGIPLAMAVQLWPTPTSSDANSSGAAGYPNPRGIPQTSMTLTDAVVGPRGPAATWPTPAARD